MKTMILYASSKGYAAQCAAELQKQLGGDAELVDLKKQKQPDLSACTSLIIGGSIHASNLQGAVKKFCSAREQELLGKPLVGLFLCAMEEKEVDTYFQQFPQALRDKASVTGWFGGRIDFSQHSFFVKVLLKKAAGMKESVFAERPEAVQEFARKFRELQLKPQ